MELEGQEDQNFSFRPLLYVVINIADFMVLNLILLILKKLNLLFKFTFWVVFELQFIAFLQKF